MSKETPTLDEKGYQAIIADVRAEVAALLKSAKEEEVAKLAKSHPGEENSSEPPEDTSASETAPAESAPESKEPPVEAAAEETPSAAPPTEEGPPEAAPQDVAQETGPLDPVALKAEYCQLPVEDLQVHYLAAKEALQEKMAAQQQMAQPAPAPAPMAAAAPPAPAAPAAAPPMAMKSEVEAELEALKKKQTETDNLFEKLITIMNKQINVPLKKGVSSLVEVDNNKPVTDLKNLKKSEVQAILRKKLVDGKLSKSDQELIVKFDCNMVKFDQISHLLA